MARMSAMIHERICKVVCKRVPSGGRVLEVSCARGKNLHALKTYGYNVQGTNYSAYKTSESDVPIDLGVDVIDSLPYEDAAFDCVLLCDVIEHLSDHAAAIRNMARVLKPGGLLVIVTPNIMRINSRIHFLLTGFFKIKRSFIGFDVPVDQSFVFHNHPPHLPTLVYQLHSQGMDTELDAIEYKVKSVIMWLLLALPIQMFTWFNTAIGERFIKGTPASKTLRRLLTCFPALCGEAMVIFGTKRRDEAVLHEVKTRLPEWSIRLNPALSKRSNEPQGIDVPRRATTQ